MTGLLGCHETMDVTLVYNIMKALFEHLPELAMAPKEVSDFTLAKAAKGSTIPFHSGAIKYFKEKGSEVK